MIESRWTPGSRSETDRGDEHGDAGPPSIAHVKRTVSSDARKLTVASPDARTGIGGAGAATSRRWPGPAVTVVSGVCRSSNNVLSKRSGPVSATRSWLPTRGRRNELWVEQPLPAKPQV